MDTEALSSFEEEPQTLFEAIHNSKNQNVVLTPHGGEFKRLFGAHDEKEAKLKQARKAAKASGACVV